jgi:hypothetical protein
MVQRSSAELFQSTPFHFHGVGLGDGVSESIFAVCGSVVCAFALLALFVDLWCVFRAVSDAFSSTPSTVCLVFVTTVSPASFVFLPTVLAVSFAF